MTRFTVKPGMVTLYRVVDWDNPQKNAGATFTNHYEALLWELLTNPDLLPVPLRTLTLNKFPKTTAAESTSNYRFPAATRYRLLSYKIVKDFPGESSIVSVEDIDNANLNKITIGAYTIEKSTTRVFGSDYQIMENGRVNLDAAFRTLEAISKVGEPMAVEMQGFRVANRAGFIEPSTIYSVNWEALWILVLTFIHRGLKLDAIITQIRDILSHPEKQKAVVNGFSAVGYDDCLPEIFGYQNPGNSCFIDSTLMAMIAFKTSPFTDNLINKGLQPRGRINVCSENNAAEDALRKMVYDLLVQDYLGMVGGERVQCIDFRRVLGRECNITGQRESDFAYQFGDPFEFYYRLLGVLNYNPMTIRTTTWRAPVESGEQERAAMTAEDNATALPTIDVGFSDVQRISWPETWRTNYENVQSGDAYTWKRTEVEILDADVVVVHINRAVYGAEQVNLAIPPMAAPNMNALADLFENLGLPDPPSTTNTIINQPYTFGPSNPALRNDQQVNDRVLEVETSFLINQRTYDLRAAVYSPRNGHYAALLRCGSSWFSYDDTETERPLFERKIETARAMSLIQSRGVLLFYYEPFPLAPKTRQEDIQKLIQTVATLRPN